MTFPFYYLNRDGEMIKVDSPKRRLKITVRKDMIERTEQLFVKGDTDAVKLFDVDRDLKSHIIDPQLFEETENNIKYIRGNAVPVAHVKTTFPQA